MHNTAEMGDEEQEVVFRCLVKTPRQTDPSKVL